uniref:SAP domain-containing protein n=1 Tax=Vitrella brassicaformis TaxID=1169539 RepID=A0A7S1JYR9_9ALVE
MRECLRAPFANGSHANGRQITLNPADERRAIEEAKGRLSRRTVEELKTLLRLNNQSVTGDKAQLVARAADREVRGAIPKCPKCKAYYLRYREPDRGSGTQGVYYCPGRPQYDEDFCGYESSDVQRIPWRLS